GGVAVPRSTRSPSNHRRSCRAATGASCYTLNRWRRARNGTLRGLYELSQTPAGLAADRPQPDRRERLPDPARGLAFVVSLFRWDLLGTRSFLGLENYRSLLADGALANSLL